MLVFHTSDQQFFTPDVIHSRDALDFGKGFYVTRLREQAVGYADRFLKVGIDAVLHIYEFTLDTNLRIKVFDSYNEEWLNFVCNCRKGSNDYKQYDII